MKRVLHFVLIVNFAHDIHAGLNGFSEIAQIIKKHADKGILGSCRSMQPIQTMYPVKPEVPKNISFLTSNAIDIREREKNEQMQAKLEKLEKELEETKKTLANPVFNKVYIQKRLWGYPLAAYKYYDHLDEKLSAIEGRIRLKLEHSFYCVRANKFDKDIKEALMGQIQSAFKKADKLMQIEIRSDIDRIATRIRDLMEYATWTFEKINPGKTLYETYESRLTNLDRVNLPKKELYEYMGFNSADRANITIEQIRQKHTELINKTCPETPDAKKLRQISFMLFCKSGKELYDAYLTGQEEMEKLKISAKQVEDHDLRSLMAELVTYQTEIGELQKKLTVTKQPISTVIKIHDKQ